MENLSCSIEGRPFQALLVTLCKKNFHGDKQIDSETLAAHYASLDIEEASMQYEIASLEEVRESCIVILYVWIFVASTCTMIIDFQTLFYYFV